MQPDNPASERLAARCCVVGGGPAGMVCGFLLARAGIDVVVRKSTPISCAIFAAIRFTPRRSS